jgi:hypothetical protein
VRTFTRIRVIRVVLRIRLRRQLHWDNLSRRSATSASGAILRPKRCTSSHARELRRALEIGGHPAGSELSRRSLGSIHPEHANETCSPLLGTRTRDQQCSCFRSFACDDGGREDGCQSEVGVGCRGRLAQTLEQVCSTAHRR